MGDCGAHVTLSRGEEFIDASAGSDDSARPWVDVTHFRQRRAAVGEARREEARGVMATQHDDGSAAGDSDASEDCGCCVGGRIIV